MNRYRHMALAWGLLLAIVAMFAATMWIPWNDRVELNRARIESMAERIARFRALASTQAELTEALTVMQQSSAPDDASQFITAKSPTLGAADLQRRIKQIIVEKNGRQVSSQPLDATEVADLHQVEVNVNLTGSLPAIQEILFALEFGQPRIFIKDALIQASAASRNRSSAARRRTRNSGTQQAMALSARLLVFAYMQRSDESDATPQHR